jgi:hypothetical protein
LKRLECDDAKNRLTSANPRLVMERKRMGSRTMAQTGRGRGSSPSTPAAKAVTDISRSGVGDNSDGRSHDRYDIADLSSGRGSWDIAARKSAYLASVARKFASGGQESIGATAFGTSATDRRTRSTSAGTNAENKGVDGRWNNASTKYREGSPEEFGGSWLVGGSSSMMKGPSIGPNRLWPAQDSPSAHISAAAVSAAFSSPAVSPGWREVASPTYREDDDGGLRISFSRRRKSRGFTRVGAAAACTCTKAGLQCTCNNSILPYQVVQVAGEGTTAASSREGDAAASEALWAQHVHVQAGNGMEGMEEEEEEEEKEE